MFGSLSMVDEGWGKLEMILKNPILRKQKVIKKLGFEPVTINKFFCKKILKSQYPIFIKS